MKRLFIFTVQGCVYCEDLRRKLLDEKISFFTYDVDHYPNEYLKLYEATGLDLVPSIWIKSGEENTYIVPERDFITLDEAVQKIKETFHS